MQEVRVLKLLEVGSSSFIFDKNKRETNEIEETSTPSPNKGMALPEVLFRVVGEREHLL